MNQQFPTQAQVVIIGGGIVGCSTAYHLTKIGYTDVVLLERKELGSGTTWAAAGLVAQLRQNREMTNLAKYATELYPALEAETGAATGYVKTGALGVCQTEDRRREWLRGAAMAAAFGIEMFEISLKEAEDLVPGMSTKDLVSVFYLPGDAHTNPLDTTQSLIKGAKMKGAKVFEHTRVTGINVKNGAVCGVSTESGDIACEYAINCAGMWGRDVGKMVNVSVPLFAAEHMHAITKPIDGIEKIFPTVRDFDGRTYFKCENGGILLGGFEAVSKQALLTRYGMDCYAYALLAAGQIDLVIEAGLNAYDIQGPIGLIHGAGGIVTDWTGGPAHNGGRAIAAANAEIHAEALAILRMFP